MMLKEPYKSRVLKWIEALRSGNYKQDIGKLRPRCDSYCCLGVACDLSQLGTWVGFSYCVRDEYAHVRLSLPVAGYYGLSTSSGGMLVGDALAVLNDGGKSFDEIATVIEQAMSDSRYGLFLPDLYE